jgi:hypothetical protein
MACYDNMYPYGLYSSFGGEGYTHEQQLLNQMAVAPHLSALACVDFSTMPCAGDAWVAVDELESAIEACREGIEKQISVLEDDTKRCEAAYFEMEKQVQSLEFGGIYHPMDAATDPGVVAAPSCSSSPEAPDTPAVDGPENPRSLLVCYFPREANKEMIRQAFAPFGEIETVYLVHKDGKPACYGFVNFREHESAAAAHEAARLEKIELHDKRNAVWHVKAEWTATPDIPKKPKKKRLQKADRSPATMSGASTPPLDLRTSLNGYHPKLSNSSTPNFKFSQLSYVVPSAPLLPTEE